MIGMIESRVERNGVTARERRSRRSGAVGEHGDALGRLHWLEVVD